MKVLPLIALTTLAATPMFAEDTRQLDSHEHGVGQLDIAFDGVKIAMELHAPGADIVGFEYEPESEDDIAKVDVALAVLAQPLDLFELPEAAQCSVIEAKAELEAEDSHDDHDDHDEDGHDEHDDHDDHDEDEHDDHDEHEEEGHDDHDDHDGEDHADEAGHTEFHAEYLLECGDVTAVTEISFAYFAAFPNALEVEVRVLSDAGATAFEVERDAPMLDLSDLN